MNSAHRGVLALAGGVGGAKLAAGLQHAVGDALTVVVNTGDDFEHLGLHISPDLDTVMFTLGGVANKSQGWGLEGETWNFIAQLERLDGPAWFRLGDKDIANHVLRTSRLADGHSLSRVTKELCAAYGVRAKLLPMSDDPVRTIVHSGKLAIPFQEYFVKLQCGPRVDRLEFRGADTARMNELLGSIAPGSLNAVVFCPSNPYLSIDPILSISGFSEWLRRLGAPVVAVSPIVAGTAIKGPAAKIMRELGHEPSAKTVAAHYRGIIDGLLIDSSDSELQSEIQALGIKVRVTNTVMKSDADRITLAEESLRFAREVAKR
ncbi:MAG: 2-phospho-L-lactate transferase [Xanthobacteraceae bacterium]|nr:2-phospho-L-lactate transferase [Xanthobacteraceae bacterium]